MALANLSKPIRGTALLASRERRAERTAHEQREMQAALKRDGRVCRWPRCEFRSKKLPIDPAHVFQHRGSGGNPSGDRTRRDLIMAACRAHHGLIDADLLSVKPVEDNGTDGLLSFYRRTESGAWECVGVEQRIGVSVTRS